MCVHSGPAGYYDKFTQQDIAKLPQSNFSLRTPYPKNKPNHLSRTNGIPYWRNLTSFNLTFFQTINAVYLSSLAYMDYNFGKLYNGIDSIDNGTISNNTAIFMSTDHGDFGGDYNCVEKYPGALEDVLINIPLVARIPKYLRKYNSNSSVNANANANGVRITSPTESFDIFKTILGMSDIDIEFNQFGRDLSDALIYGNEIDLNRVVFSEAGFYWHNELFPNGTDHISSKDNLYWPRAEEEMSNNGTGSPKCVSMQNLDYKLVFRPDDVSEFYDLKKDPRQINNLWNNQSYSSIQSQFFYNLTWWLLKYGDTTPILTDSRSDPTEGLPTFYD